MEARMKNPAAVLPGAWQAVVALNKASDASEVPADTMELVHLRVSQINGCSACVASAAASKQSPERLVTVAAWREAPYFTDAERAALALTEAATRLADRSDPVPDDVWDEAARHYDEQQLAGLVIAIASINTWNRINATTRQITGEWVDQWIRRPETATQAA
jgi:AhpD family alkylhydroperoxidase